MENQSPNPQVDGHQVKEQVYPETQVFTPGKTQHPNEATIALMLKYMGEDPTREGLVDTPKRVVRSWRTLFGGYRQDPKAIASTVFESEDYDQMVVLRDIELFSTCEHHLLPFFGKAHVAYIPKGKVIGLSKLARLVEVFSRRLQIQERLTKEIAGALFDILEPAGVGVVIEAKHFCMIARGVQKQNSVMTTSDLRGNFRDAEVKEEFFNFVRAKG